MEIEAVLGIKIDVRTEGEPHGRIRPRVLAKAPPVWMTGANILAQH